MIAVVHDLLELSAPGAEVRMIEASELPEPQRRLLDHTRDMTGTLEAFLGQRLGLRAHYSRREGSWLYRRVVLLAGVEPVEYGAIRIHMDALPAEVTPVVEQAREPLGGLLSRAGVELTSEARGFLCTDAPSATKALDATGPLYGRLARLMDGQGRTLADVVEILPPFAGRD